MIISEFDEVLTVKDVARLLNIHHNTVRRWSDQGLIKGYRIGPRQDRKFRREDVDKFLTECNLVLSKKPSVLTRTY